MVLFSFPGIKRCTRRYILFKSWPVNYSACVGRLADIAFSTHASNGLTRLVKTTGNTIAICLMCWARNEVILTIFLSPGSKQNSLSVSVTTNCRATRSWSALASLVTTEKTVPGAETEVSWGSRVLLRKEAVHNKWMSVNTNGMRHGLWTGIWIVSCSGRQKAVPYQTPAAQRN